MGIFETFTLAFMEEFCIFIIWSKVGLSGKNILLKNLAIILITSALITSLSRLNLYFYTIINYSTLMLLVCIIYKKRFMTTIIELFSIIAFIMILQLVCMFIYKKYIGNYQGGFLISITIQFILSIFLVVISHFIPILKKYFKNDININPKILFCFLINLLSYILILKIIWIHNINLVLNNAVQITIIIISILSVNIVLYFYLIKAEQEKKDSEVQNKYNEILNNITGDIRARQHDFKNHLNVIYGLIESTNEIELKYKLKEYISSLNKSMIMLEDILYIENPILRAIIYSKISEANNKNINFLYSINTSLTNTHIKDYELSEVLTNLIDNAFEAVESQESEKLVSVKIYLDGEANIIEIINSGATLKLEDIKNIFEKGFSTKHGDNRGYGLYNAKKIVESTGGKFQLSLEKDFTIFKLFIR